jgi:hypothetical protein
MPADAVVERWVEEYRRSWEEDDGDSVVALFTPDARYRSQAFREPHVGSDGIYRYWTSATGTQLDTRVSMGTPLIDGDRVAVEWWTTFAEKDGGPTTLPGVLLLEFHGDLCRVLRENWCYESGSRPPFEGWGVMAAGDTEKTRGFARSWARAYGDAWRAGDPEIGDLFAEDVVFRSAPLREPKLGRAGVLDYTRWAMAQEAGQDPVLAEPIVHGRSAAVEWWCAMVDEGEEVTLSGCSVQTYDENGLVVDERDYWNDAPGIIRPHVDWGPRL